MGSHKTSSQETMVSFITVFSVLVLSPTLFAGIPFGGYSRAIPQRSVLETLTGDDQFSTLVAAVKIAFEDPAAVLASVAPLTLFAPTNDVFAAVPEDTLNGLLADPEALKTVLLRHIVANNVVGLPRQMVKSAEGGDLSLDRTVSSSAGSATITKLNILASDGIIHAIDSLL